MYKSIYLSFLLLILSSLHLAGQNTDKPLIGAQVIIEEGQTPEQIEKWFRILNENGMEVCRIRMFENYMNRNGIWDFTLFDAAFDAAYKYGIKIFATLFPYGQNSGIGGFKYPSDDRHKQAVSEYIKAVVTHFKDHPALYCWVLQNEPGGALKSLQTPYYRAIKARWLESLPRKEYDSDGYMKADLSDMWFARHQMADFIGFLSDEVHKYDPETPQHINPHQIFRQLGQYDFGKLSGIVNSMGASMHPSWHFTSFRREEYALAVALNSDIVRNGSDGNPFWITELQGGNNLYSGTVPICPTAQEIEQWLWTGITSGAEGIIFWCLNPRASCNEGGEWALLTYQDEPSKRMESAAKVISCINEYADFFADAEPVRSDITLMYNPESIFVQTFQARKTGDGVRENEAPVIALIADYMALSESGIEPDVSEFSLYDWDADPTGKTIILPNMVSLPSYSWEQLENFVTRGGHLVMTSMTGFFDENAHCIMLGKSRIRNLLGADLSEYQLKDELFDIDIRGKRIPVSFWKGIIKNSEADTVSYDEDGVTMVCHRLGKGKVTWCPSMIELGAWHNDISALAAFLTEYVASDASYGPVRFDSFYPGILMRTLKSGGRYLTFICNKSGEDRAVRLKHDGFAPSVIYGQASIRKSVLKLSPEESAVIIWDNHTKTR